MRTSLFCIVLVSLIDCFSIGFLFSPLQHVQQRLFGPLHILSDSALKETNNNGGVNDDREPLKSFSSVPQYDPSDKLELRQDKMNVGNPQIMVYEENDMTVTDILRELAAIRQEGPQKYCILGTRHCSYLHQQIIELLYVYCQHRACCFVPSPSHNSLFFSYNSLVPKYIHQTTYHNHFLVRTPWF